MSTFFRIDAALGYGTASHLAVEASQQQAVCGVRTEMPPHSILWAHTKLQLDAIAQHDEFIV